MIQSIFKWCDSKVIQKFFSRKFGKCFSAISEKKSVVVIYYHYIWRVQTVESLRSNLTTSLCPQAQAQIKLVSFRLFLAFSSVFQWIWIFQEQLDNILRRTSPHQCSYSIFTSCIITQCLDLNSAGTIGQHLRVLLHKQS